MRRESLRVLTPTMASLLIISVFVSGCMTTGNQQAPQAAVQPPPPEEKNLTAEETALRSHVRQQRVVQSAAAGCMAGAGVMAVRSILIGQTNNLVRDAAVGCLAGGIVGAATGAYIDARAQNYANDEERISKMTAAARDDATRCRQTNEITKRLIAEQRRKLTALKKQAAKNQERRIELESENKKGENTIALLNKELEQTNGNIATMENDIRELNARQVDTVALKTEHAALIVQRDHLNKNIGEVKRMYASAGPGV